MIAARWLGAKLHRLDVCDSTNDEAAALASAGAPHGTVVIAREQRGGRGRGAHLWHSPPEDNLYVSCILRPDLRVADVAPTTLAVGIGVHDAMNLFGVRPSLKWPNDLLVRNRKLAGILTEMNSRADNQVVDHIVVGIGVNVNTCVFPPQLASTATSLRLETGGRLLDTDVVLVGLLRHIEIWLDRFFADGVFSIADAWTERANIAGQRVKADAIEGIAQGINETGALLIVADDGTVHRVTSGQVLFL